MKVIGRSVIAIWICVLVQSVMLHPQSGIVGSVFLVLQPVLMNSEERKGVALSSNQDTEIIYLGMLPADPWLSIHAHHGFHRLGFAEDYGICKATRKDGTPCTMPVNKRRGKYCTFHLQQEFAKMKKSTRAALQSTEPTRFAADGKHKHLSEVRKATSSRLYKAVTMLCQGTYSSASTLAKRAAGSCAMVGGGTWAVRSKLPPEDCHVLYHFTVSFALPVNSESSKGRFFGYQKRWQSRHCEEGGGSERHTGSGGGRDRGAVGEKRIKAGCKAAVSSFFRVFGYNAWILRVSVLGSQESDFEWRQ